MTPPAGTLAPPSRGDGAPPVGTLLAITGTDTGVGKTIVAAGLLALARQRGLRVGALKPVETGVTDETVASDAARLAAAAAPESPSPALLRFADPVAPMVAARLAGESIDLGRMDGAVERLRGEVAFGVVEGAGGLLVPVTASHTYADLFARWSLPLLIVAADRLGVINHTLLTTRVARAAGLRVAGIVLNRGGGAAAAADASTATNGEVLSELCADVPLFGFPRVPDPGDISQLAEATAQAGLGVLFPPSSPTV